MKKKSPKIKCKNLKRDFILTPHIRWDFFLVWVTPSKLKFSIVSQNFSGDFSMFKIFLAKIFSFPFQHLFQKILWQIFKFKGLSSFSRYHYLDIECSFLTSKKVILSFLMMRFSNFSSFIFSKEKSPISSRITHDSDHWLFFHLLDLFFHRIKVCFHWRVFFKKAWKSSKF